MTGLPGRLPAGERVLWQGRPDWRSMTRRVFHLRGLAIYFGLLLCYTAARSVQAGTPVGDLALGTAKFAGLAAVPVALLALYAWGTGRATTYTITNRRVAIRLGMALPMTVNLPFARIDGAAFHHASDGTGDIVLQLAKGERLAYLLLWPHARPWRMARAEPMLRAVHRADEVAQLLARALAVSEQETPARQTIGQLQDAGGAATIGATRPHAAAAA